MTSTSVNDNARRSASATTPAPPCRWPPATAAHLAETGVQLPPDLAQRPTLARHGRRSGPRACSREVPESERGRADLPPDATGGYGVFGSALVVP